MIAGLCESPLTFQAIVIWRDELNEGKVSLRDIIDLDATHAGPDAKAHAGAREFAPDGQLIAGTADPSRPRATAAMQAPTTAPATATPFNSTGERIDGERAAANGTIGDDDLDDDDDMENWLSVSAIEAELKPKVIETFDAVASAYKSLRRLQDQDIQFQLKRLSLSPAQERKYKKLKNEIIGEVQAAAAEPSAHRHTGRSDSLTRSSTASVGYEGRLMRSAESHGVSRDDFLKAYRGSELDPLWLNRVSKLSSKGWKSLVAKDKDAIKVSPPRDSTRLRARRA